MYSRRTLIVAAGCALVLPYLLWQLPVYSSGQLDLDQRCQQQQNPSTLLIQPQPQKRFRVAVASHFGFHFDVYMALVWTLERVMARPDMQGSVEVFAEQPFGYQFHQIVDELRLYRGGAVRSPESLVAEIGTGEIDLVVLGTCEIDLRAEPSKALLAAWDARPNSNKFKLVCIVHNIEDTDWQLSIPEWSRRNAIRILPIAEHVGAAFRRSFLVSADSADPAIRSAGLENVPVDVHVPVLDLAVEANRDRARVLANAVIQGSFFSDRRDYHKIFAELNESLAVDPKVWGYLPLQDNEASYRVDTSLQDPPFRLFLIGSGYIEIPEQLQNVVVIRDGLDYPEFYALMSQMDICVPAFSSEHAGEYYDSQASSTFAMAVECDVPILVTERIKKSYTYVDDRRAVVTRPAAMREVEALRALRAGDVSYFLRGAGIVADSPTAQTAQRMIRHGWVRSAEESRAFKESIWAANERVVERILRDL
ncbi:hypothetical protein HMN09_00401300 [Mycena chlorophos]|uniref:Uncharacterized protein n=1 Tax=Mycena chlorophos TaxID=658473 RepID=A0A8H6TG80_MYCCL|nr:hypothetical protein HMN09_00401300 [Mycena chlorophos]